MHPSSREGCVSPDLTKTAALDASCRLIVRGLVSGRPLHVWTLPYGAEAVQDAHRWGWAPCSQQLAMPIGGSWNAYSPWRQEIESEAGLLLLDTLSGSTTVALMQVDRSRLPRLTAVFCPSRALVLVACTYEEGGSSGNRLLCVYDFAGTLVSRLEHHQVGILSCIWAPSAQTVLVQTSYPRSLCLWKLSDASAVRLPDSSQAAQDPQPWAESGCLALYLQHKSLAASTSAAWTEQMLLRNVQTAWDSDLVLLTEAASDTVWALRQLQLFTVQGSDFALRHRLRAPPRRCFLKSGLQLSADGTLCAVMTCQFSYPSSARSLSLAIVELASGSMWEYACPEYDAGMDQSVQLRWRCDNSAVLVSCNEGRSGHGHLQLLSFLN